MGLEREGMLVCMYLRFSSPNARNRVSPTDMFDAPVSVERVAASALINESSERSLSSGNFDPDSL